MTIRELPNIETVRTNAALAKGLRRAAQDRVTALEAEIRTLEAEDEELSLVSELFRKLVDAELAESVQMVEKLLTEGLQAVFEDMDLRVTSTTEVLRGKVSVEFITVQRHPDGKVTEGLTEESFGGAVTTVESVLLRVILMARRSLRGLLLLDESLPAVENRYLPNLVNFLKTLGDRMGVDMLVITHNPVLVDAAPRAYRIRNNGGTARFEEVRREV